MSDRLQTIFTSVVAIVVAIVLWEISVRLFDVPEYLVPTPTAVLAKMVEKAGLLAGHAYTTLYETIVGFLIGVVIGIACAIVIVYSRFLANVIFPLILILQIVPKVAIAPLFLIWFGYGWESKMLIAFLICFFPIIVNTVTGLRSVEPEMVELVRALEATDWQIFRKVRLPNSLPFIFSGFKISITLAVIGAIIGEFVGGNHGLGYLIILANFELDTPLMFGSLFFLSVMGLVLYGIIELLERLLIPWSVTEEEKGVAMGI
ncbi:MAG: ABC transporter permease [Deltaproteobacteria bacterium]|nr:ABC transporter permease [Deltaproteobacteria bacterium]